MRGAKSRAQIRSAVIKQNLIPYQQRSRVSASPAEIHPLGSCPTNRGARTTHAQQAREPSNAVFFLVCCRSENVRDFRFQSFLGISPSWGFLEGSWLGVCRRLILKNFSAVWIGRWLLIF